MRVAVLSTYPPRRCGLATFATDLRNGVLGADSSTEVVVAAVVDDPSAEEPAPEVLLTLSQHERADYVRAAEVLNSSDVDVVLVQHEYGIFGGEAGEYVLDLLRALTLPYVVTLHTLLLEPSPRQRAVLRAVVAGAAQVTVFTAMARDQLVRSGLASWDRVAVVNHGAPEHLQPGSPALGPARRPRHDEAGGALPELADHADRRVLSTFGLLSAGKGLEVAVRALARVREAHPEVLYVVAGRTHPAVVRHEGERYRRELERLTAELGLEDHVLFVDRYLSDADIRELLSRTEIFLTPYRHEEQVVSGVLTFALVAGCPVVSTPYFYATELLSTGAGRLVGFDDHEAMAAAVAELLGDAGSLDHATRAAHSLGSQYTWPEVGREMVKVLGGAVRAHGTGTGATPGSRTEATSTAPEHRVRLAPPMAHLERLADRHGLVQHAVGLTPDPSTGYCVDDVARLGLVTAALARQDPQAHSAGEMARRSVDFLEAAWDPRSGAMHNLRDVDGRWLDEPHHGDHVGRTLWALGDIGSGSNELAERSRRLLHTIIESGPDLHDPRAAAFGVLGLARLPGEQLGAEGRRLLRRLAEDLAALYTTHASPDWQWFEDVLTYDNARFAQALISAAASQRNAEQLRLGLESLEWYCAQCGVDGDAVVLVGNEWRHRDFPDPPTSHDLAAGDHEGDEQPLDAAALVEACVEAYRATGSSTFGQRARDAFAWFHGRNRWGLALYDEESGGCHDGVGPGGVNANEGAESTLAYVQAWLALESVGLLHRGAEA